MSRPFINVTDDAGNKHRVMVSKIVRWGVPQSKYRSESAKSYLRLVGDNPDVVRLSNESPDEIDALIEAALADQQPADREPQAALPRTDEPQDTIARLEAIRAKNPLFWWAIACPQPDNMQFRVFIGRLGITERTFYGDTIEEAVEAAIKEIGNG